MPNSENGTSGLECKCNTQFFVPSTEFFPEDVELQFWKGSPLFPLETVFSWGLASFRLSRGPVGTTQGKKGWNPFQMEYLLHWWAFHRNFQFPISNFQFPKVAYHLLKVFRRKIWSKSKWHMPFWVIPAENFREQRNSSDKVVLFFRMESSKRKLVFHFFKAMFDKNFRPSRLFFGKWNQFVQM